MAEKNPGCQSCMAGIVVFIIILAFAGMKMAKSDGGNTAIFLFAAGLGIITFFIVKSFYSSAAQKEKEDFKSGVMTLFGRFKEDNTFLKDDSIISFLRGDYFGGHKGYSAQASINIILSNRHILVKGLYGNDIEIIIPLEKIADYGLYTKEKLKASTIILVGILAFALKDEERYLYIKFTDQFGIEHNPVFGGPGIGALSDAIYKQIASNSGNQQ